MLVNKWQKWLSELPSLKRIKLPRCYTTGGRAELYTLHTFSDASDRRRGSVSYLVAHKIDEKQVSFVFGKARTVPKGVTTTIPQLKLMAAEMAAIQHAKIKNAL